MVIRSKYLGAEMMVPDTVKNLKPLVKAVAEDAGLRREHEALKAQPDYKRPVFPNEPWPSKSHWGWGRLE
jgi:hypothetical protein